MTRSDPEATPRHLATAQQRLTAERQLRSATLLAMVTGAMRTAARSGSRAGVALTGLYGPDSALRRHPLRSATLAGVTAAAVAGATVAVRRTLAGRRAPGGPPTSDRGM